MAVMARGQLVVPPPFPLRLLRERRERRPRGIARSHTGDIGPIDGRRVSRKADRLLEAAKRKIAQLRSHELPGGTGLEAPDIELLLGGGPPPTIPLGLRLLAECLLKRRGEE